MIAFLLVLGAIKAGKRTVAFTAFVLTTMVVVQILFVVLSTRGMGETDFGQVLMTRLKADNVEGVSENLAYRGKEAAAFLDAAKQHIFWGSGLGATIQLGYPNDLYPITTHDGHNIVLQILYKSGVLGIILFLGSVGLTTWRAIKGYFSENDPLINMVLLGTGLALPLLILTSLTVNRLSHFEGAFFIGLTVAVVEIARGLARQAPAESAKQLPCTVA